MRISVRVPARFLAIWAARGWIVAVTLLLLLARYRRVRKEKAPREVVETRPVPAALLTALLAVRRVHRVVVAERLNFRLQ